MKLSFISRKNLPQTDLGWIKITDHFIATVGKDSGKGKTFGNLLVLADAELSGRSSFPMHQHAEMEILTWVVSGVLYHRDNLGNEGELEAHTMQLMSARNGMIHAEGNRRDFPVRLLQIWIQSNQKKGTPFYQTVLVQQKGFQKVASPNEGLLISQEVEVFVSLFESETYEFELEAGKIGYGISIGELSWNQNSLEEGAGVVMNGPIHLTISGTGQALLFVQNS